jgi:hypothetical protein
VGSVPGFVFKAGPNGVGYYRDTPENSRHGFAAGRALMFPRPVLVCTENPY